MPQCFVIGCRNGRKKFIDLAALSCPLNNERKNRFFSAPRDPELFKVWEKIIPKLDGIVFTKNSRVCDEHFQETDIIKDDVTIINGKEIKLARINWKLKKGISPSIFIGTPTKLLTTKKPIRKQPTVRLPLGNIPNYKTHHKQCKKKHSLKKSVVDIEINEIITASESVLIKEEPPEAETVVINELIESKQPFLIATDADQVQLPSSSWQRVKFTADSCNYYEVVEKDSTTVIQKNVNVDLKNQKISVTIQSGRVPDFDEAWMSCTSTKEMEGILLRIHQSRFCPGITYNQTEHPHHTKPVHNGTLVSNIWRAKSCRLLIASSEKTTKACSTCKLLDRSLKQQFKRNKIIKDHTTLNHRYMNVEQLAKKVCQKGKNEWQLKNKIAKKNIEINALKLQIKELHTRIATRKKDKVPSILDEANDNL